MTPSIAADNTDGVLRLHIPVNERAKPHRADLGVQRSGPKSIEPNSVDDDVREPVGAGAT